MTFCSIRVQFLIEKNGIDETYYFIVHLTTHKQQLVKVKYHTIDFPYSFSRPCQMYTAQLIKNDLRFVQWCYPRNSINEQNPIYSRQLAQSNIQAIILTCFENAKMIYCWVEIFLFDFVLLFIFKELLCGTELLCRKEAVLKFLYLFDFIYTGISP